MQTRTITINLNLLDSTAKIFDEALFNYDDYFLNEVQDRIEDLLASNTAFIQNMIQDVAYTLVEDFNDEYAKDPEPVTHWTAG